MTTRTLSGATAPVHVTFRQDRAWAAAVFAATFLLRWLTLSFDNDDFTHIAWAAQMLHGERPVRDFVEPGLPLQTLLAYLSLRLGGFQVAGEGLIAAACIGAGAAFTYLACRRLGLPRWLALVAVTVAAGSFPRLYGYPKALVYPAAVWAVAEYVARPRFRGLALLSAVTAIAFLFRHDHGVWVGLLATLSLTAFHLPNLRAWVAAGAAYGGLAALLVAPWMLWVAVSGHADRYFAFAGGRSEGLVQVQHVPDRVFELDRSAPLVTLAPVDYPRVGIRWAPEASPADRREREQRYGLQPLPDGNGYRLTNVASANVSALLLDPLVEDTAGIDRGSRRAPAGLFPWIYLQLQRYVPPVRLRVLPGAIASANAQPWLTYATFVVPWLVLVAAGIALAAGWRRAREVDRTIAAVIVPTAILSIVTYQTLVRGSPDSRLGDVAGITAVLAAWFAFVAWQTPRPLRFAARPVIVVALTLTVMSALSFGQIVPRLAGAGVDGPTNLVRRARDAGVRFSSRALDVFAPPEARGLPMLARWINECTGAHQRVAMIGFEPQMFVIAERGFAGGMAYYENGWMSEEPDQRLTLARWARQDVPIVLAVEASWETFSRDYDLVRAWMDERYELVEQGAFGGNKEALVFVSRSHRRAATHGATGLPCFLPQVSRTSSWDLGLGFGTWDLGFGIWDLGFEPLSNHPTPVA